MKQTRKHTLNTLAERVSPLFVPGPVLLLWLPLGLAGRTHGSSRLVARGGGCQSAKSDHGTCWRPGRTRETGGGPTVALACPPVVAGKLVAPLMPHSSLVLGDGSPQLALFRGRVSLPRSLLLYPGQVIPKVPFGSRTTGRELPLLHPSWEAWKLP